MEFNPFAHMQRAVDIVNTSAHPTNKIAAAVSGAVSDHQPFLIAMTNYWPDRIHACFGTDARIGNSSGTIHAETACLLNAPGTDGASVFVTDPFCPNCAKNMAEAGIKAIYIDHKGFAKDFADRRGDDFDDMSLRICRKAGMAVYSINRKQKTLETIFEPSPGFIPHEDRPVVIDSVEIGVEQAALDVAIREADHKRFAAAIAHDQNGKPFVMTALAHPVIGYSYEQDAAEIGRTEGKYTYMLEPVNRLMMNAARHGLRLADGLLYCSQTPTAREQVNLVGTGITRIRIGDPRTARDHGSLDALDMLTAKGILTVTEA